ncbi:MAG: DNA polymerase III subunit delta, partial [Acetobacteraceae bacterium]
MKLEARAVAGFLRDPGACRVVLLYGEDQGQIRERARALVTAVVGNTDDPFRVAELDADRIGTLPDEAATFALTGGRRAVRVREIADTREAQAAVAAVLRSAAPALVVLEGAGLAARSTLRTMLEAAPDAVAIGCYADDGRNLAETIRATLAAAGVQADAEASAWLVQHLGVDRALTRAELEKLALYAGPAGRVDLAAA